VDAPNAPPTAPVPAPYVPLPALVGQEALLCDFARQYSGWTPPS